jgi:hypothetical protein
MEGSFTEMDVKWRYLQCLDVYVYKTKIAGKYLCNNEYLGSGALFNGARIALMSRVSSKLMTMIPEGLGVRPNIVKTHYRLAKGDSLWPIVSCSWQSLGSSSLACVAKALSPMSIIVPGLSKPHRAISTKKYSICRFLV